MSRMLKARGPILVLCVMGLVALLSGACMAANSAAAASPTPSPSLAAPDAPASRASRAESPTPTADAPVRNTSAGAPSATSTPAVDVARAAATGGAPAPAGEVGGVCDPCMVMTIAANGQTLPGEVMARSKEGTIEVLAFYHEVKTPRDSASGMATGRRQYQPLIIRKRIDKASPLLMKAMTSNTPLTVTLGLYRVGADGRQERYYTIKLENAMVSGLSVFGFEPQPLDASARTFVLPHVLERAGSMATDAQQEELALTFSKIIVTNEVTKTSAEDSWSGAQ